MATINQSPQSATIDTDTVAELVGLCYFDPVTETLLELSDMPDTFLSVAPNSFALKKLYMVMSPDDYVNFAQISIVPRDPQAQAYSVKVIISETEPSFESYGILPAFNSFVITNPPKGAFRTVWLLVENVYQINEVVSVDVELSYEPA